jgi:hypothetical protein
LKSTTKFENWWYDYRISYVDTKTFVDYRTEYFRDGQKIKVIDRDWVSMKWMIRGANFGATGMARIS